MNTFVQTKSRFGSWHGLAAASHRAVRAVRRWEARRLATARVRGMSLRQLQAIGVGSPQALAIRYGVAMPANDD